MDKSIPKAKPLFKHYLKSSIPFSAPKKKDTFILQDFLQGSQNISDQNNEYTYITENNGPFPLDENYSHDENYYKEYDEKNLKLLNEIVQENQQVSSEEINMSDNEEETIEETQVGFLLNEMVPNDSVYSSMPNLHRDKYKDGKEEEKFSRAGIGKGPGKFDIEKELNHLFVDIKERQERIRELLEPAEEV